jgi:hypothetical protein
VGCLEAEVGYREAEEARPRVAAVAVDFRARRHEKDFVVGEVV